MAKKLSGAITAGVTAGAMWLGQGEAAEKNSQAPGSGSLEGASFTKHNHEEEKFLSPAQSQEPRTLKLEDDLSVIFLKHREVFKRWNIPDGKEGAIKDEEIVPLRAAVRQLLGLMPTSREQVEIFFGASRNVKGADELWLRLSGRPDPTIVAIVKGNGTELNVKLAKVPSDADWARMRGEDYPPPQVVPEPSKMQVTPPSSPVVPTPETKTPAISQRIPTSTEILNKTIPPHTWSPDQKSIPNHPSLAALDQTAASVDRIFRDSGRNINLLDYADALIRITRTAYFQGRVPDTKTVREIISSREEILSKLDNVPLFESRTVVLLATGESIKDMQFKADNPSGLKSPTAEVYKRLRRQCEGPYHFGIPELRRAVANEKPQNLIFLRPEAAQVDTVRGWVGFFAKDLANWDNTSLSDDRKSEILKDFAGCYELPVGTRVRISTESSSKNGFSETRLRITSLSSQKDLVRCYFKLAPNGQVEVEKSPYVVPDGRIREAGRIKSEFLNIIANAKAGPKGLTIVLDGHGNPANGLFCLIENPMLSADGGRRELCVSPQEIREALQTRERNFPSEPLPIILSANCGSGTAVIALAEMNKQHMNSIAIASSEAPQLTFATVGEGRSPLLVPLKFMLGTKAPGKNITVGEIVRKLDQPRRLGSDEKYMSNPVIIAPDQKGRPHQVSAIEPQESDIRAG